MRPQPHLRRSPVQARQFHRQACTGMGSAAKAAGATAIALYALHASRRAGLSYSRSVATAIIFLAIAAALVMLKHYVH